MVFRTEKLGYVVKITNNVWLWSNECILSNGTGSTYVESGGYFIPPPWDQNLIVDNFETSNVIYLYEMKHNK